VIAFKARGASAPKAVIVVPALHPGPIGRLGGSDLPGKIAEALPTSRIVLVPHGPATHDYNPVSTQEVERFAEAVRDLIAKVETREGGSPAVTVGGEIKVTSQVFGDGALLTYTAWPEPIDDVEYGVGLAAELQAKLAGAREALFVDCHNCLKPGAGAVFLCTDRGDDILANANAATKGAMASRVPAIRAGVAQDRDTFGKEDLIGDQGVQVLAIEAGGSKHAYVLWDGNNAVPEVTARIGEALDGLVDSFQVMTTDNHSVNAVAGAYGPVGHKAKPEKIAACSRRAVERALADLEPVDAGVATGSYPDFRVFGNQKTVQLTSSINVMTTILAELTIACLVVQALASALLFYAVGLVR
jgi:putative membrane protein